MNYSPIILAGSIALLLAASFPASFATAAEQKAVYGWQLMTPEELAEHRARMQSFKTEQEREAYRQAHHERMQARAKERGVTLPDEPQARGKQMGKRYGPGPGMGPGSGQGHGPGRGQGGGRDS